MFNGVAAPPPRFREPSLRSRPYGFNRITHSRLPPLRQHTQPCDPHSGNVWLLPSWGIWGRYEPLTVRSSAQWAKRSSATWGKWLIGSGLVPHVGGAHRDTCGCLICRSRVAGIRLAEVARFFFLHSRFGAERRVPLSLFHRKVIPLFKVAKGRARPRSSVLRYVAERQSPLSYTSHKELLRQCKRE